MTFPPAVLSQHIAAVGKTGSGKTSTEKLIIEQLARDPEARICILDPIKSDHWGLTRNAAGTGKGLSFHILGGPYGHVPLSASAGDAIGRIVASGALRLSIIDMADFDMGEHAKFFIAFAHSLFRNMKGMLHLVVEEAHTFAPKEKAGFGDENKSTHWMKKIATGARSKGIRLIVATQRTQELHNAVLGSCDTMIVHRLTSPADQEPVMKWLKSNLPKEKADEIAASLSSLKTGEAWLCSGEAQIIERRMFPRISTYDNSATPTGNSANDVRPAPVDTESLRSIIGTAVEEAKANDPAELKKHIADLKRQLAEKPKAFVAAPVAPPKIIEKPVLNETTVAELNAAAELAQQASKRLADAARLVADELRITRVGIDNQRLSLAPAVSRPIPPRATKPPSKPAESNSTLGNSGLRRMLIALAQRPKGLTDAQLGVRAGLSSSSGTFGTYLGTARTNNWVDGERDCLKITNAGLEQLGDYEPLPTGQELLAYWLRELGQSGAARMLQSLAGAYPSAMTKEQLGQSAGISSASGTFGTYLGTLRRLELVTGKGELRASNELFEG